MEIVISRDFSQTPGGRYKKEGNFSGEEFREKILIPRFNEAQKNNNKLYINLDGGYGYPPSFLEEAFGGLARKYGYKKVSSTLKFISDDEPTLIEEINEYIYKAKGNENE
ncbi:MAG: STAS-like domain-containing protein [Ruminococcaceae bacterium]|nr:STAS-like domain-containing protein [Oscillospiraceae bacterium]